MKAQSVKKRFVYTLITNILKMFGGIAMASLVPRALGPSEYGNFNFLLSSFKAVRGILGFATDSGFFTYNSKTKKSGLIIPLYGLFLTIQFLFIIIAILFCFFLGYNDTLWPGQEPKYLWWVAGLEFFMFLSQQFVLFGDSKYLTVYSRLISLIVYVFGTITIISLFYFDTLKLESFIFVQYSIAILTVLCLGCFYFKIRHSITKNIKFAKDKINFLIKYFYRYCSPLVALTIVGILFTYFDRWLLQHMYGSIEQGYYSIALRWSVIILVFTTSILHIYWAEAGKAHGKKDKKKIANIYKKATFFLYGMASAIAIFVAIHSKKLIVLIGGAEYAMAAIPFMIMAFYPIHQTYGQLNGVLFKAIEQNRIHRNIGISGQILGLIVTYFLLAPRNYFIPGAGLGAIGIAIKMVSVQIIMINIQIFFHTKYLNLKFSRFLLNQFGIIFLWGGIGFLSLIVSGLFVYLFNIELDILALLINGVIYLCLCGLTCCKFPLLIGIEKNDMHWLKEIVRGKLSNI